MHPGFELYIDCFWDLCGDRNQDGRITWVARHLWCEAHGISGSDEDDLHFLVGRMDLTYLQWIRKKGAKGDDKPKAASMKEKGGGRTGRVR